MLALSLTTILASCADKDLVGQPLTQTAVPKACERILRPVANPADAAVRGNIGRALLKQYRSALKVANLRIAKGKECVATVRATLGGSSRE